MHRVRLPSGSGETVRPRIQGCAARRPVGGPSPVSRPPLPGQPGEMEHGGELASGWAGAERAEAQVPAGRPRSAGWREGQVSDSAAPRDAPRAMASILGTWLQLHPEDFLQSPDSLCLKTLLAYAELSMPDSDLEQRARHLLAQLETLEPTEAEGHGEEDSGWVRRRGENEEGRGLGHTEQHLLRLEH